MNWDLVSRVILGGSGLIGLISAYLTWKGKQEENETNLLTRYQSEVERLDRKLVDSETKELELKKRINELEQTERVLKNKLSIKEQELRESAKNRDKLVSEIDEMLWDLQATKSELQAAKNKLEELESNGRNI